MASVASELTSFWEICYYSCVLTFVVYWCTSWLLASILIGHGVSGVKFWSDYHPFYNYSLIHIIPHVFSKGISQSALPYRRSVPTWLKLSSDDVKEQIFKLAKKGLTPSQIGTSNEKQIGIFYSVFVDGAMGFSLYVERIWVLWVLP